MLDEMGAVLIVRMLPTMVMMVMVVVMMVMLVMV